jgi:peroxiredoxin
MKKRLLSIPVLALSGMLLISPTLVGAQEMAKEKSTQPVEQTEKKQVQKVAPSSEKIAPLPIGDTIPSVDLKTPAGEKVNLLELLKEKPAVIVFFRGGWCPYCNAHLAELASIQEDLDKLGVQLIALSPDKPSKLAEKQSETPLPYTLLSDSDHKAMTAFGVAFTLDEETHEKYLGYGINVNEWSGSEKRILPVPSVFVVDGKGKIKFVHANPDYKKRLSGAEVLIHAQELVAK